MEQTKYKYPRTYHVPWSLGISNDDKIIPSMGIFENKNVVVTEKLDGENTTLYRNSSHARSINSQSHESRNWLKQFHSKFSYEIPENMRICGENVFAKHSIYYKNLSSYFYVFSIWNNNTCLSWADTLEWCNLLKLEPVPMLYQGIYKKEIIKKLYKSIKGNGDEMEGYVIRNVDEFEYDKFSNNVVKFVRENHVQTNKHWMLKQIIQNKINE